LPKAIKSLINQTLSKNQYEIIVVDNASTDDTKKIIKEFSNIKNLKYIFEPILGLSQARNTGWKNAKGKYIAYLDDDAIASSKWLKKIVEVFESQTKLGCVCGKVEPIWESEKPKWLSDELLPQLTVLDWGNKPKILNKEQWFVGANMAFPKKLLEELGGFKTDLGRKGKNLLSMEETFLREQIEKKGYRCFYHPEISVKHHIVKERLDKKWFIKRFYWQGISSAVMQIYRESPSMYKRVKDSIAMSLPVFINPLSLMNLIINTDNPQFFYRKCKSVGRIGYSIGCLVSKNEN